MNKILQSIPAFLLSLVILFTAIPFSGAAAGSDPIIRDGNLALGAKCTVTSVYTDSDDYSEVKLTDGNVTHLSRWAAADSENQYIEIDLGRVADVNEIVLYEDTVYGERITSLFIEYYNGTRWQSIKRCSVGTSFTDSLLKSYKEFDAEFSTVSARKLRIGFSLNDAPAVREICVYNSGGEKCLASEITVDGTALDGFNPTRFKYDMVVSVDNVPQIKSDGTVVQASAVPGKATVTTGSGKLTNTYTINLLKDDGYMINTVIDAHKYSEKEGVTQSVLATDGSSIGNFEAESFIKYSKIDFGSGEAKIFMATLSSTTDGLLELHLDSVDGKLIGSLGVNSTGSATLFKEDYALIEKTEGVHDLYIVSHKPLAAHLDTFVISSYAGTETAEEKNERMSWWRSARYGQFIHFGAYANFPFEDSFKGYGEWVMYNQKISRTKYEKLCVGDFNPVDFNAKKIVSDADNAGVKYMVFTSKHHEGFSMFDTDIKGFEGYDLMDYGNYTGEDPIMSLSNECKAAGIKFGCYYSIMDWHHWAQNTLGESVNDKAAYVADMKGQLRELIQKYDVDILWFDGEWNDWWTTADGDDLYKYLRTLKPSLIVNNRVGKRAQTDGDYGTPEQEIPSTGLDYDWESCITMNDSWGYISHDTNWKSVNWIISSLVSTASKGGNMLLNVGPDNYGTVPSECISRLNEAGKWLEKYGESIYDTTANPFSGTLAFGTATKKEGKLYLHITAKPQNGQLIVPAIDNKIYSASLLGESRSLPCFTGDGFIIVMLPDELPDENDSVVVLTVEGTPKPSENSYLNNNIVKNKPAVASDVYFNNADYNGAKAVDGNSSTRWATGDSCRSATLEIDLGETMTFNTVNLSECTTWGARVDQFKIEYFDGGEWKTAIFSNGIGNNKSLTFDAVSGSKIRLNIESCLSETNAGPTINEMQVFNLDANITILSGDIDCDGKITVSDVVALRKMIMNGDDYSDIADLDNDGKITVSDVVALRKKIMEG